jgi:hypothetical protein
MHRRAVTTAALAALLVSTPAVAYAYSASEYVGSVSTTSPAAGSPFTVTIDGPADASVVLTVTSTPASIPDSAIDIAGTKSLAKTTDSAGTAVYAVTLTESGTYSLVATDAVSGAVILSQAVQVASGTSSGVLAAGTGTGTTRSAVLAVTGSDVAPFALGASALLILGAGAVILRRRRAAAGD